MTSDLLVLILVTAIGSTALGSLVTGLFGRPKAKADAAASLTTASISLVAQLQERVAVLEDRLATCEATNASLKEQLDLAHARLALYEDRSG